MSEEALVYLTRRVTAWESPKTGGHGTDGRAAPGGGGAVDLTADPAAVSDVGTTTADVTPTTTTTGGTPHDAKSSHSTDSPHPANQESRDTHEE